MRAGDAAVVDLAGAYGLDRAKDVIVEVEFEDGFVLHTTPAGLAERQAAVRAARAVRATRSADRSAGERDGAAVAVPADTLDPADLFEPAGATRGVGTWALRVLRFLDLVPEPPSKEDVIRYGTAAAVAVAEAALVTPRLALVGPDGSVAKARAALGAELPILVLVHGTMSSTAGSFGGILGCPESLARLRTAYGPRICALEHHTLTVSPVRNAIDLVNGLPVGARVHLLTHSRGGLVGELLVWASSPDVGDLDATDARALDGHADTLRDLGELRSLARERRVVVERFVRVACPAAGTILASDRLDTYVSAAFAVVRLAVSAAAGAAAPAARALLERMEDVVTAVVSTRCDAELLPGVEAQRPESPFTTILNRPDRRPIADPLFVVAGDVEMGGVLPSLRAVAGYAFFLERNDLVVDTRSMGRGLPRARSCGAEFEAPDVHHFSYFRRPESRDAILGALAADPVEWRARGDSETRARAAAPGAGPARGTSESRTRSPAVAPPQSRAEATVLILPDLFALALVDGAGDVWVNASALLGGKWSQVARLDSGLHADGPVDPSQYAGLAAAWPGAHVEVLAYDWRRGAEAAAAALAGRLDALRDASKPVHLVGHGLGGLGVLLWISRNRARWTALHSKGSGAVAVAPPVAGSDAVLRFAMGDGFLARAIRRLDGTSAAAFGEAVLQWPGALDLLPDVALETTWWDARRRAAPATAALAAARTCRAEWRTGLTASVEIVLGSATPTPILGARAEGTPAFVDADDARGDGWMVAAEAGWGARKPWWIRGSHERLLADRRRGGVVADLLRRGKLPESFRSVPTTPEQRVERAPAFPDDTDLVFAVSHRTTDRPDLPVRSLQVEVVHGDLRHLESAVLVGHHEGDVLWGAERALDEALRNALALREGEGYPGPVGTAAYFGARPEAGRDVPISARRGAIVFGLGPVGSLSAERLARGVRAAARHWALEVFGRTPSQSETGGAWTSARFASVLVGTSGLGLSVRDSVRGILRGVLQANRDLQARRVDGRPLWDHVRIDRIEFVEQHADAAEAAVREVRDVQRDRDGLLRRGERIDCGTRVVRARGARGPRGAYSAPTNWWRRLIVREVTAKGVVRGLRYTILADAARVDDKVVRSSIRTVDDLVADMMTRPDRAGASGAANALFELLLPNSIKNRLGDGGDLLIVVDRATGRHPWELLGVMRDGVVEPLVRSTRILRQFRTRTPQPPAGSSREWTALVIGDPPGTGYVALPGALEEAREVRETLGAAGFRVAPAQISPPYAESISAIFGGDLRVLHIAAHGRFDPGDPAGSGVVLGPGSPFGAGEFRQLRTVPDVVFLNCCHLARLGGSGEPGTSGNLKFAGAFGASVAEALIEIGARCVVVAGWAVDDVPARTFARTFYEELCRGAPFGEAVSEARRCVLAAHGATSNTWGAYQCYGDPEYRLPGVERSRSPSSGDGPATVERAQAELLVLADECKGVERLQQSTDTASEGSRRADLERRLADLQRNVEAEWPGGRNLELVADAWRELGRLDEAIRAYDAAVQASDGSASLRALEQSVNMRDRRAREHRRAAAAEDAAIAAALEARAAADIVRARGVGDTPERLSLHAALLKRRAQFATDGNERRRWLGESAALYDRAAASFRTSNAGDEDFYPLQNVAALRWALGEPGPAREALERARGSRALVRPLDFWAEVGKVDLDLLDALVADRAPEAAEFEGRYQDAFATATERERVSALGQIEFLLACGPESGDARAALVAIAGRLGVGIPPDRGGAGRPARRTKDQAPARTRGRRKEG